ncbi:MAG: hypothetical protein WCS99_20860 [Limisphaerales bacterium]
MNPKNLIIGIFLVAFGAALASKLFAAETQTQPTYEYVTIRWAGRDNTHVIRPGGHVEFIGPELRKSTKPDRADERSFYLNLAMNGLTKDGFEFAGITPDDIIMKRARR